MASVYNSSHSNMAYQAKPINVEVSERIPHDDQWPYRETGEMFLFLGSKVLTQNHISNLKGIKDSFSEIILGDHGLGTQTLPQIHVQM